MQHTIVEHAVQIPPLGLFGDLVVPEKATGIILFAHGSGSRRHSTRNRYVARVLQEGGFGTLLLDLLTPAEEQVDLRSGHLRFDIHLLVGRLVEASDWLQSEPSARRLPIGYFGASTGGGAALVAAAERPSMIHAVVSRGGRPDLAGPALPHVKAPTLLIVGGEDYEVIRLNRDALAKMRCKKHLSIVPGATHLFEEPGALEQVAELALTWFKQHLALGGKDLPDNELGETG
jgi:dienelactone hydrolase